MTERMTSTTTSAWDEGGNQIELRLPASSAYLAVLRTAAAGLAARLDFTLDEIEDLRIAVDEACALLLPQAGDGAELVCRFRVEPDALAVRVTAPTLDAKPQPPRRDSFAWRVLTALAGEVDAVAEPDGHVTISLRKRRGAVVDA